jgi:hypothetical protein
MTNVLFRPEEVHGASGIPEIFKPFPDGNRCVGRVARSLLVEELSIPNDDPEGFTAVETRKIHRHCFAWEKPADRQRFEPSLSEPFLLAVNGDPVLGWKVAERAKGSDVIGSRIQPAGNARGEQIVERLSPLFDGESEFGRQFSIKRRLARFHHAFYDDMKGLVQEGGFLHDIILLPNLF